MVQAVDIPVALCRPSASARPIKVGQVLVLKASIQVVGLRQPINVRKVDGGYEVRGGGHRVAAFRELGRETIPAFVREDDDLHAELAEIDENLCRNDLTPIERDIAISRRKVVYEQLHPETVLGAAGNGRAKVRQNGEPTPPVERFTKATAEATGRGERTIQRSVARVEAIGAAALGALVETSLDAPAELDALAALSPERRERLIERAVAGEKVSAKVAAKQERRDEREAELASKIIAAPDGKFGVIVEDFEWDHETWSEAGKDRHAGNHYPVSRDAHTAEEIVARTKDRFACAADDCINYMWATIPHLAIALKVMELRGFAYKSHHVWVKDSIITGYWCRGQHEILLIGTKGKVVAPAMGTQASSVIRGPSGEHSEKPDTVMEMIERLFPNIPKLELNSRRSRPGWTVWGLDAQAPIVRSPRDVDLSSDDSLLDDPVGRSTVDEREGEGELEEEENGNTRQRNFVGHNANSYASAIIPSTSVPFYDDLEIPAFLDRRRPQNADQHGKV